MSTPSFRPGFRLSAWDVVILAAGVLGTALGWRGHPELAILGAVVVSHFFLFCNVFRVARGPELAWSAVFLACAATRVAAGASWLVLGAIVAAMTIAVIWRAAKKESYHGVMWRRVNPDLPTWWSRQHGHGDG